MRVAPAIVLCVFACGEVKNPATDADVAIDAAIDAPPAPLPPSSTAHSLTPDGIEVNAARTYGTGLVIVGSRASMAPDTRDGVLMVVGAGADRASFVGGTLNDQLYAVATRATALVAVGLTRSFRGTGQIGDQSMVVRSQGTGYTVARYYVATDEALQLRAVEAHGTGWAMAGRHLNGDRIGVVLAGVDTRPTQATSIGFGLANYQPRQIATDGTRVYVVGHAVVGTEDVGFVLAVNGQTLSPVWARRVSSAVGVKLHGVTVRGATLEVVGARGVDGLHVSLDSATGQVMSSRQLTGRPIEGARVEGGVLWLAGRDGSGSWAGFVDAGKLRGAAFASVAVTVASPAALVTMGSNVALIGSRNNGSVEVPLNADPIAACGGVASGSPFEVDGIDADVTLATQVAQTQALTLNYEELTAAQITAGTVQTSAACL